MEFRQEASSFILLLISHIQNGYELETDSLGGNPVLRRSKDNEEIRPLSANRNDQGAGTARTHQTRQRSRPAYYRAASEKEAALVSTALAHGAPALQSKAMRKWHVLTAASVFGFFVRFVSSRYSATGSRCRSQVR